MCGTYMCGKLSTCKQENRLVSALCVEEQNQFTPLTKTSVLGSVYDQSAKSVLPDDQVRYSSVSATVLSTTRRGTALLSATSQQTRLRRYLTSASSVTRSLRTAQAFIGSTIREITQLLMWFTSIRTATLSMEVTRLPKTLVRASVLLDNHSSAYLTIRKEML